MSGLLTEEELKATRYFLIKLLEDLSKKYPQLRLGQLIENAMVDSKCDLLNITDDKLVEKLLQFDRKLIEAKNSV